MRTIQLTGILFVVLCVALPRFSHAAPWAEFGDAGGLPNSAQVTTGTGALTSITGSLSGDFDVDVYKINVSGGGVFSATTVGLTSVDTKLFLFNAAGTGVYMNDDADVFTIQSTLPAGDPKTPAAAGVFYLAIAGFDLDPVSASGLIFPEPLFPEGVFGPTGPGGGSPVTGFQGSGDFGSYAISLTGATFAQSSSAAVPEPSSALLMLAVGSLLICSVGRREVGLIRLKRARD